MRTRRTLLAAVILLGVLSTACSIHRRAKVAPGEYEPVRSASNSTVERMRVDRDHRTAWFILANGSRVITPFIPRPRSEWPEGCPTNVGSTAMEVLEIEMEVLTIAETVFHWPVLVRNCPPSPEEIVLRSDGEIDGGGTACSGTRECFVFAAVPGTMSLPHSMKGYELYSWIGEGEDGWIYTLVTGTNRDKSYAELAAPENVVTEDGWIKLTVRGTDALESVLDLLPEDETIIWFDAGQLEGAPAMERAFPDPAVVREIERACQQREIHLMTLASER
ncbi:MAG: hypothetical protein PVI59_04905 [Anaerolineae bacterium]